MEPLVSIRLMTYNHEQYIAKAIESVLKQKTDFHFEIVIGDDFSTDDTLVIAKGFQEKFPDRVRILKREKGDAYHIERKRLGRLFNFVNIINHCKGKYIALLDGDDYFIDENKLQKQVDLLESRPGLSFCFHDILMVDEKGNSLDINKIPPEMLRELSQDELVSGKYPCPPTASVMYRREALPKFPDWFYRMNGDYAISVLLSRFGNGGYVPGKMSAYRWHSGGLWTSSEEIKRIRQTILMRTIVLNNFKLVGYRMNVKVVTDNYLQLLKKLLSKGKFIQFINELLVFFSFVIEHPISLSQTIKRISGQPPARGT